MKDLKTNYYKNKAVILQNHTAMTDRSLAFFQGACWALACLDKDLEQDYICMCEETDKRLK